MKTTENKDKWSSKRTHEMFVSAVTSGVKIHLFATPLSIIKSKDGKEFLSMKVNNKNKLFGPISEKEKKSYQAGIDMQKQIDIFLKKNEKARELVGKLKQVMEDKNSAVHKGEYEQSAVLHEEEKNLTKQLFEMVELS